MAVTAMINYPNPSVIQLLLGNFHGPLHSDALGAFDPRRDLDVYINGLPVVVSSFSFDQVPNRYTLNLVKPMPWVNAAFPPLVQLIHHMPTSPFYDNPPPS